MGSNLGTTGEILGVDESDYVRIRKAGMRRRIAIVVAAGLTPILTFVSGFVLGVAMKAEGETVASTYPLAAASIPILHKGTFSGRTRIALLGTVAISVLAFGLGLLIGSAEPETTSTTRYGALRALEREV
ncbi:MAG: hypothetical protein MUO94_07000 [Thermoplasmata archaeon]|nr:hypothetical protein [Thermoplasmata archaeon]